MWFFFVVVFCVKKMDNRTDEEILVDLNRGNISKYGLALAYCVIVIIAGILGNTASIVFYGFKSHRTTTNILITYLAVTDLIACVAFVDEIVELCLTINFTDRVGCKFIYFINHWLVIISPCILVVICVDRFRKICRPHLWQFSVTTSRVCIGGVIVFAFLTSVRDFAILDIVDVNITDPNSGRQIEAHYCTHTREPEFKSLVTISHLLDLLLFIVVVGTLSVIYSIIAVSLWKHRKIKLKNKLAELHSDHDEGFEESTMTTLESHSVSVEKTKEQDGNEQRISNKAEGPTEVEQSVETLNVVNDNEEVESHVSTKDDNRHVIDVNRDSHITTAAIENPGALTEERDDKIDPRSDHLSVKTKSCIRHSHVERNVTIMMIVITVASILSFVPYFIVNLTLKRKSNSPEQEFEVGIQIALRSFILNNAVNPYITGIFNPGFRRFVKKLFRKCICCTTPSFFRR